ncbi:MAG TPA: hypothetical protein VIH42_05600 [Thermoguttaceae bacterium]
MALDTRDKLIAALATGLLVPIYKSSIATQAAGYISSLWRATGSPLWAQGAIPGAAATPTDATTGGILLPSFGSNKGYVLRFAPILATIGTCMLCDRLAHMGGLSGTVTTAQTVNASLATAFSNGRCQEGGQDVQWFVEIYTNIGTTAANLTVTYTDQADTSGKTVVLTGFSGASPLNQVGRCVPIVPGDGLGIKSIQTVQLSVSTGTAGSFGITAVKQLTSVGQMLANILAPSVDAISIGLPEIKETSCLAMQIQCSTTSTGIVYGEICLGQA